MRSTWKQLLSISAAAAAILAVSIVAPSSANAFWFWDQGRGAPEVDPSTLGSALALAMGGLAVLGDRLRRR